jgi:hypothetical protein
MKTIVIYFLFASYDSGMHHSHADFVFVYAIKALRKLHNIYWNSVMILKSKVFIAVV